MFSQIYLDTDITICKQYHPLVRMEPETPAVISLLVPSMKHLHEIRYFDKVLHRLGVSYFAFQAFRTEK